MAEELHPGRRIGRVAKVAAKREPADVGFRVVIRETKFIPGRGWMQRECDPQIDEDSPRYFPGCNDEPPDDSPVWQPAAPPESEAES